MKENKKWNGVGYRNIALLDKKRTIRNNIQKHYYSTVGRGLRDATLAEKFELAPVSGGGVYGFARVLVES